MGAWDSGPFDNDIAADWCLALEDSPPVQRWNLIREALTDAAEESEYLENDAACEAIAAAAVVASQRPGGAHLAQTTYAPDFLAAGGTVVLPEGAAELARRALDRIVADESAWLELWEEAGRGAADAQLHLDGLHELLSD